MTHTERLLNLFHGDLRSADVTLLALECFYRRESDNVSAKEIHRFREEYLIPFIKRIKEEKAEDGGRGTNNR